MKEKIWYPDQAISLTIADDGSGLSGSPEKINHYGLTITTECAKHLGGELMVSNQITGGVLVSFDFIPDSIKIR